MSNFCLYFCIKEHIDKIKIDYYIIPVKKNNNLFTSVVSEETFDLKDFKELNSSSFVFFNKQKKFVECRMIFENLLNIELEIAEKMYIPIIQKYIKSKIPFRFKFKKKLDERVHQLLN